jgi:hypothetical protein
MLPDLNEYMVKEHQKWLQEQARQIALQRKYSLKRTSFMKFAFSYLTKFMAILF